MVLPCNFSAGRARMNLRADSFSTKLMSSDDGYPTTCRMEGKDTHSAPSQSLLSTQHRRKGQVSEAILKRDITQG